MSAQHRSPFNKDDIIAEPLESGSRLKARRATTYNKYIIFHTIIFIKNYFKQVQQPGRPMSLPFLPRNLREGSYSMPILSRSGSTLTWWV